MARTRMPKSEISYMRIAQEEFIKEIDSRCVWVGIKNNEALGEAVGVSHGTVSNFKRDPGRIRVEVLQKLVKKLKLDPGIVLRFLGYSTQDIRDFAKAHTQ